MILPRNLLLRHLRRFGVGVILMCAMGTILSVCHLSALWLSQREHFYLHWPERALESFLTAFLLSPAIYYFFRRGWFVEISRWKSRNKDARSLEQGFQLLFENNPSPMWVYDVETLEFLAVNEAALRQYGYAEEEFLSMTIRDIRPKEDVAKLLAQVARVSPGVNASGVWRHCTKAGTVFPVQIISHLIPFADRHAKLVLATDITDLDRTEQTLRQSEEQIRQQAALLDITQDAIVVTDLNGRVLFWNKGAERLYGWRPEEARSLAAQLNIFSRLMPPARSNEIQEGLREKGSWRGELQQITKDKREIIVESRVTCIQNEAGDAISMLFVNTDITEKKSLEKQFLRAQRLESLGTLASGIAHDLNNILSPILLGTQLIRGENRDPDFNEVLDQIESAARRGSDIIRQLLTFGRGIEGQRLPLQLKHLLREIEKILQATFPKSVVIKNRITRDLWAVEADATQLHQVLMNLSVNARDAMPDGGLLVISAENRLLHANETRPPEIKPGPYVLLEVADTGTGIPPEIAEHIFDPFFSTKEPGRGTGLGLSTALGIVKSHGGFIQVKSKPGEGSVFQIFLPALPNARPARPTRLGKVSRNGRGQCILIVDDEQAVCALARQILEAHNYQVECADNGADALAKFLERQHEIKLVVTDLIMPVMDGLALVRALKKVAPALPIVLCSGAEQEPRINEIRRQGRFLSKPYSGEDLLDAVNEVETKLL